VMGFDMKVEYREEGLNVVVAELLSGYEMHTAPENDPEEERQRCGARVAR